MKRERLDQILIRLGYVTEEEVQQALLRQKSHGGRVGSHLVYFKFITESQLAEALSIQHGVPAFDARDHAINNGVVQRLPIEIAWNHAMIPVGYDDAKAVKLVVADPTDEEGITAVKRALHASNARIYIAPETIVDKLIAQHHAHPQTDALRIVELPERFEGGSVRAATAPPAESGNVALASVLMVSKAATLANFLSPVFEREGYDLHVTTGLKETEALLRRRSFHHVMVSEDRVDELTQWLRTDQRPEHPVEVSTFSTVSGALLDNPVPYRRIVRSLIRALRLIADTRCAATGWMPPYVLICNDIYSLAKRFGFHRIAIDGLHIASYLLVPSGVSATHGSPGERSNGHMSFVDFDKSLDYAKALQFPWDIAGLLQAFLEYLSEIRSPLDSDAKDEIPLAAQILALVWYRRVAFADLNDTTEESAQTLQAGLREQAGRLASLDLVEEYLRQVGQSEDNRTGRAYNQIFVVGREKRMSDHFASRLTRTGFHCVTIEDLGEAQRMCERRAPAAILIHRESYPDDVGRTGRLFKLNPVVLLYAFSGDSDPSVTLRLLDAGYDDVFVQPFDCDLIAARISKDLRGLRRRARRVEQPGGFGASFGAFAFIDLIQALAQSMKTVHVRLSSGSGETADLYVRRGRMVHAACGDITGEDAVYRVISWGDDGSFTVEPEDRFPPDNIVVSNEAILMEGCRLWDESRV